jgi:hypothetical protein
MNVVMKSQDRNLFGIVVRQSTNGSMLNLSDLQDAYDTHDKKRVCRLEGTKHQTVISPSRKWRLYD